MADESVIYSLASIDEGTISFNNGDLHTFDDVYWVQNITGLDSPPIRAPIDNKPQGHGGIIHNFFMGPRLVTIEGVILVQSVPFGGDCRAIRNQMEYNLRACLQNMLDQDGQLTWTATGQAQRVLNVRHHVPLEFAPAENYAIKAFTFGLVSEDAGSL
jgi:hypothetical protein